MIDVVIDDFERRVGEIDSFFLLLQTVEQGAYSVDAAALGGRPVPGDWGAILKGAAHLVLYNLVEAFTRRGLESLFGRVQDEGLSPLELAAGLRAQWVGQRLRRVDIYSASPKTYHDRTQELVQHIVEAATADFSADDLPFSGNLHPNEIRRVCQMHGVTVASPPEAKGGMALEMVTNKRNALGHGDESFAECGRQFTVAQLVEAKDRLTHFVRGVLGCIKRACDEQSYRVPYPAS